MTNKDKVIPEKTGATSGTVSRALQVLTYLADADEAVTVKEAAAALGLAASTTHRLLNLLKDDGFVSGNTANRSYDVGPQFYRIAARLTNRVGVVNIAQNTVQDMAAYYDETVLFGLYLPNERAMSFAARGDGKKALTYRIEMNTPISVVWGASGKALLAHLPEDEIAVILSQEGPAPATGRLPPDFDALVIELRAIRRNGFSVSISEKLPGARGIAAPVFGPDGVIGSLCLTSPADRVNDQDLTRIGEEIAATADRLSHDLGARRT